VRRHRRTVGRGSPQAVAFHRGTIIVVLLRDRLTMGERSLVAAGREDAVLDVRARYQELMSADLVAAVEQLTGRRIEAFMSANHVDPDLAVELFVLDRPLPADAPPHAGTERS
jgi:uncharacterized protein YbcI